MAPTPITVGFRLTFAYTVALLPHRQRNFCEVVGSGDPSGYDLVVRPGFANAGVQDAVDAFFTLAAPFYNVDQTTFDGWLLESLDGGEYVFVAAGTTTAVPGTDADFEIANGLCLSGKESDNSFMPMYLYEGQFGRAFKYASPDSLASVLRALTNAVWNVDGTATDVDQYAWRRSRNGLFGQRWLADIVDTNEKLRRVRRIK